MYATHHDLVQPPDNAILWRYQTLETFRSLILERALHFARLDKLHDPREGTLTSATAQAIKDFLVIPNKERSIENTNALQQRLFAVNCWHWDDYENNLMWSSFANPGVAIKTRFDSLKECFRLTPYPIYGAVVQYVDHHCDLAVRAELAGQGLQWSALEMAALKYPSFQGEKEVRLIRYLMDAVYDGRTGIRIRQNYTANGTLAKVSYLHKLLPEVILSPDTGGELEEEVKELVRPINDQLPQSWKIQIRRSTLYG